jgi:hypothetical protein
MEINHKNGSSWCVDQFHETSLSVDSAKINPFKVQKDGRILRGSLLKDGEHCDNSGGLANQHVPQRSLGRVSITQRAFLKCIFIYQRLALGQVERSCRNVWW